MSLRQTNQLLGELLDYQDSQPVAIMDYLILLAMSIRLSTVMKTQHRPSAWLMFLTIDAMNQLFARNA